MIILITMISMMELIVAQQTHVRVLDEVTEGRPGQARLCFQKVVYAYEDGSHEAGFRFIYRRDTDDLQPARGQARLESVDQAERLIALGKAKGW